MSYAVTITLGVIAFVFGGLASYGVIESPTPCVLFTMAAAISAIFAGAWK